MSGSRDINLLILFHNRSPFADVVQAILWGALYVDLGAINSFEHAISFSIGALKTCGGSGIFPGRPWIMLSEIRAVYGIIAFGLTTAFLFTLAACIFPKM